ncbi:DUF6783 domain-containing protein [Blautia faecis]
MIPAICTPHFAVPTNCDAHLAESLFQTCSSETSDQNSKN